METLKPKIRLIYAGKDITSDVSKYLSRLTYTDKTEGNTDEIQIELEDTDGLWIGEWYPQKGDQIQLFIGYDTMVDCGTFEVDEIRASGPPEVVTICGLAAAIKKKLRTKNSRAYESQTLRQIAQTIAVNNGLTVEGTIENIRLARVTQDQETDLGFLRRIAGEYGYLFSVRGTKLIFTSIYDVEKGKPVRVIDRADIANYSFTDKVNETFAGAKVSYNDPVTGKVVEHTENKSQSATGEDFDTSSVDVLEMRTKAENKQQAEAKAKAALYRANSKQIEGRISIEGDPIMVAGNNFELTGMGALSGKFHVEQSVHAIDGDGGYTTALEIKRVGFIEKVKQTRTKPRKTKPYAVRVGQ